MPSYSRLYRVFPWLPGASIGETGHPLYTASPQGRGRIDNPEHYLTLYACDAPTGAIGEAFGNHSVWTSDLLEGPPGLSGSRRVLATLEASRAVVIDLDDPQTLVDRSLRPSRVVTRDRAATQSWALEVFAEKRWDGIRWWSFHSPEWGSFGIWNTEALKILEVVPLVEEIELVKQVASQMHRVWDSA